MRGMGSQGLGTSSTAFPDRELGAGSEVEKLGLQVAPLGNAGTEGRGLPYLRQGTGSQEKCFRY